MAKSEIKPPVKESTQAGQEVKATGHSDVQVAVVESSTELIKRGQLMDMFEADAGSGISDLSAAAFSIPFMSILQKGSPQVSKMNPKYIKGAEPGFLMNNVTGQIFPGEIDEEGRGGLSFIPCMCQLSVVRWKPRDSGGGLVGHYSHNDPFLKKCRKNEKGQPEDPETHDVFIDTAYHYGLSLFNEFPTFSVVSMASTQLKASRAWNTLMKGIVKRNANGVMFNPPMYSHVYRLSTVYQSKDKYDWYGWKVETERELSGENKNDVQLYLTAKEFYRQIKEGLVQISAPSQELLDEVPDDARVPF